MAGIGPATFKGRLLMMRRHTVGGVICVATLLLSPQQASATRAITACDPETGECGVAAVTGVAGVGAILPVGDADVAVANMAWPDIKVATAVLRGVAGGLDAQAALSEALPFATYPTRLQMGVAALDSSSQTGVSVAAYTGAEAVPNTCQVLGGTYVVTANVQTATEICGVMGQAFEAAHGLMLSRRLQVALVAGAAVGGDRRGEISATLKVWNGSWVYSFMTPVSVSADYVGWHWIPGLAYSLEEWLGYWQPPGDPRELVEFTTPMMQAVLTTLRQLGYYDGRLLDAWSTSAEKALGAWVVSQFVTAWEYPTVYDAKTKTRMIERKLAHLLMYGEGRDFLTPSRQ